MAAAAGIPAALLVRQQDIDLVLNSVVGMTQAQINHFNDEGFCTIDDLTIIDEETLLDVFPEQNRGIRLTTMTKMKLKAMQQWAIDQKNQLPNPNDEIDVIEFDDDVCAKIQSRLASKLKTDKDSTTAKTTYSGTLGTFTGEPSEWMTEKRKLLSYLGQQKSNCNNVPLSYVVRDDEERPDQIDDDIQDAIWNTPLHGPTFDIDNYIVYQIRLQWTSDENADSHVDAFSESTDGRGAFELLWVNFEGTDYRHTAITTARQRIEKAFYQKDGPKFTFDTYC
jgi:hypothetical protein